MRGKIISVAMLTTSMLHAALPIDGWYYGVFGGYTYLPNNIYNTSYGLTRTNAEYASGYNAGGNIGFKSNPMRYEAELTYLNANLNKFNINGTSQLGVSGYNNAISAMANIYYDFPGLVESIQPFLGLGIGYSFVQVKMGSQAPFGVTKYTGTNSIFTYQGTAGITYNFAENYAINLAYRYLSTTNASELGRTFQANMANVGVVYRFDGQSYK